MKRETGVFRLAATVGILALAPALAQAYIDPGNGAYMVQALFTVVAAGVFYLRHPIRSAKLLADWIYSRVTKQPRRVSDTHDTEYPTTGTESAASQPQTEEA